MNVSNVIIISERQSRNVRAVRYLLVQTFRSDPRIDILRSHFSCSRILSTDTQQVAGSARQI